jgi:hypothetical protein
MGAGLSTGRRDLAALCREQDALTCVRDLSQLGPLHASAGQAVSGYLEVPALGDASARIPVSLVRGAHEGPVLALTTSGQVRYAL